MSNLWEYLVGSIFRPRKTFARLNDDPDNFVQACLVFLVINAVYCIAIVGFLIVKLEPWVPTLTKIPLDVYYIAECLFYMPLTIGCLVMAAGFLEFFGFLFGSGGNFKKTLSLVIVAIFIPLITWAIWDDSLAVLMVTNVMTPEAFHESIAKPGLLMTINWTVIVVGFVWHTYLMTIAAQISQKISAGRAFLAALVAVIAWYLLWFVTYIR